MMDDVYGIERWCAERVVRGAFLRGQAKALYADYAAWCAAHPDAYRITQRRWADELCFRGCRRVKSNGCRMIEGLRLRVPE